MYQTDYIYYIVRSVLWRSVTHSLCLRQQLTELQPTLLKLPIVNNVDLVCLTHTLRDVLFNTVISALSSFGTHIADTGLRTQLPNESINSPTSLRLIANIFSNSSDDSFKRKNMLEMNFFLWLLFSAFSSLKLSEKNQLLSISFKR